MSLGLGIVVEVEVLCNEEEVQLKVLECRGQGEHCPALLVFRPRGN